MAAGSGAQKQAGSITSARSPEVSTAMQEPCAGLAEPFLASIQSRLVPRVGKVDPITPALGANLPLDDDAVRRRNEVAALLAARLAAANAVVHRVLRQLMHGFPDHADGLAYLDTNSLISDQNFLRCRHDR
jgi:hypothetical protein